MAWTPGADAVEFRDVPQLFPVDSLYVEANEPPLDLRWLKLTLQYIVKL